MTPIAIKEMQDAKELAENIIATIHEPLIVLDGDLRVIVASPSFYSTFELNPKETEGVSIYELGNGQWDKLRELLENLLPQNTTVSRFEIEIGQRVMLLNARQIVRSLEKSRIILLACEDISKRKQAEEELIGIFKAKSTFTSMVSHELRTPLTSLKQSITLLAKGKLGKLNAEQKKFFDIAVRNLERLMCIINNVLDFQKFESGKMTYKMEENDIHVAIQETKEMIIYLIEKNHLEFIVETPDKLPKIIFDKVKIIQVLTNLIYNAIKATVKGSIKVKVSQIENFIQVAIQDTGCGIKHEDISKLFKEYEQLKRKDGGTGLGLVISQNIILAHHGKIWVESAYGNGTTVYFLLPIQTSVHL